MATHRPKGPRQRLLSLIAVALSVSACDQTIGIDAATIQTNNLDRLSSVPQRPPALLGLAALDPATQLGSIERLDREWEDRFTPALLEYISLGGVPSLQHRAMEVLRRHTGQDFGYDLNAWFSWVWRQSFSHPGDYADFKSRLYAPIDSRFAAYFGAELPATVSLDEVRWGGVRQDGIPPLRAPNMILATDATYLDDENVVFGIEVNGDTRAYPKRILAWHEMFVDTVGGVPVVGVYCTLCGSMILYESTASGSRHEMGTSGFLFRSNKLMYDQATQSLWNTMWGKPVIGELADRDIRLPRRSVVTTTWGEWRRRHPQTQVLSLRTGHGRDYSEGAAYKDYFSSDKLMFNSSKVDSRLPNKAEIFGLTFRDPNEPPLAITTEYGRQHPLLHEHGGAQEFVVLTDASGAMRAYATGGHQFSDWDGDRQLTDNHGTRWLLSEDQLTSDDGQSLPRLASHNAFWFGWYGAYSNTRLLN